MNVLASSTMRRGACPGLSAPMATGDGLLARLTPSGATIALAAFRGLCAVARRHGSGVIEITSRGSIQVRGLTAASAGPFAAEIAALGIPAEQGIPVMPDPLSGLDEAGLLDSGAVADRLRQALAASSLAARLPPKVSVIVDGYGALHLDDVAADVRLRAVRADRGLRFHVALGGTAASAISIGTIPVDRGVECTMRLLELLTVFAPGRMRQAVESAGAARFTSALVGILQQSAGPAARSAAEPVGIHPLRSGEVALGIALAFGHSDAETLRRLFDEAENADASGLRTAPGRALLFVGMSPDAARNFAARATLLGFIADSADPRRKVVACAGAPICSSGQISARALAPVIAQAVRAANIAGPVHVSGCAKGCAHAGPTPLSIFGRAGSCDIHLDGKFVTSATADALPAELERLLQRGAAR